MRLAAVIVGTIFQTILAYFLFMVIAFGFSAIGTTYRPSPLDDSVLNSAFYLVPISCIASAIIVIVLSRSRAGKLFYLWYCAPLLVFSGYLFYIELFIERVA